MMIVGCKQGIRQVVSRLENLKDLIHIEVPGAPSVRARVDSYSDDEICMTTESALPPAFVKGQFFICRVYASGHPIQFSSSCIEIGPADSEGIIKFRVSMPQELIRRDARAYVRIDAPRINPLPVQLHLGGQTARGSIVDVSHSGFQVELSPLESILTDLGQTGSFEMEFQGELLEFPIVVMWRRDLQLGVLLPEMGSVSERDLSHKWLDVVRYCLLQQLTRANIYDTVVTEA